MMVKTCPKCQNKDSIVIIQDGYLGHKIFKKYKKGEIILGCCMSTYVDPDYHFDKCNYEWSKGILHYERYAEFDEED